LLFSQIKNQSEMSLSSQENTQEPEVHMNDSPKIEQEQGTNETIQMKTEDEKKNRNVKQVVENRN